MPSLRVVVIASLGLGPVNLLQHVKLPSNSEWKMNNGVLISPKAVAKIVIPYVPPDEFQITAVLERQGAGDLLTLVLPTKAKPFQLVLDSCGAKISGLQLIDGKRAEENPTKHDGQVLFPGKRHTLECLVTKSKIRATVDQKPIFEWSDFKRISLLPIFVDPGKQGITIFVHTASFKIHELQLTQISGRGHRVW